MNIKHPTSIGAYKFFRVKLSPATCMPDGINSPMQISSRTNDALPNLMIVFTIVCLAKELLPSPCMRAIASGMSRASNIVKAPMIVSFAFNIWIKRRVYSKLSAIITAVSDTKNARAYPILDVHLRSNHIP